VFAVPRRGRVIKTAPRTLERAGGVRAVPSVRPCVAYSDERSNVSGLRPGPAGLFDLVLPMETKGRTRPVSRPGRPLCSTLCCPMQTKGRTLGNIPVVSPPRKQTRAPRPTTLLTQPLAPTAQPQTGRPTPDGPGSPRPGAQSPSWPASAAAPIRPRRVSNPPAGRIASIPANRGFSSVRGCRGAAWSLLLLMEREGRTLGSVQWFPRRGSVPGARAATLPHPAPGADRASAYRPPKPGGRELTSGHRSRSAPHPPEGASLVPPDLRPARA
jgi:hypothetical protein